MHDEVIIAGKGVSYLHRELEQRFIFWKEKYNTK